MVSTHLIRAVIIPAVVGTWLLAAPAAHAFYWFNWPGSGGSGGSLLSYFPNTVGTPQQQTSQPTQQQPETPPDTPGSTPTEDTGGGPDGGTPDVPGVPEPSTIVAGLIGLCAAGLLRRRRRRS